MLTEEQSFWFLMALIAVTLIVSFARFGAWGVVQISTAGAVFFANIYYGWTDNGYAISLVAFIASLAVTVIPLELWGLTNRLWRWIHGDAQRSSLRFRRDKRGDNWINQGRSRWRRVGG
jgi:hypothetical protein